MSDSKKRVLVFDSNTLREQPVQDALSSVFDMDTAEGVDHAIDSLRSGQYQAVLADVGDFLPLERGLASSQSALVLDTIGEGVGIVDTDRGMTWLNRRMKAFSPQVRELVIDHCLKAQSLFANDTGPTSDGTSRRSKRTTFQVDDRYFELIASPVVVESGHASQQVVAVVWDVTNSRRLQTKIDAIDAAGYELARIEDEAVAQRKPTERLEILQDKIIKFSKDLMHFDHFAIRLLDKKTNRLEVVIAEGLPVDALGIELFAEAEGQGISGYVAATGRSYICYDTEPDPRYVHGLDGCRSTLTVPLTLFGRVVGVYNIEANEIGAFDEDDRQFAQIFGRYVAMALHILDLLVIQRYTTSETVTDTVLTEVSDPLDEIEEQIRVLKEAATTNDDMAQKLGVVLQNVSDIRERVKQCAAGPQTIVGIKSFEPDAEDHELAGKRILVADDEESIRSTVADVLMQLGCVVEICGCGTDACSKLNQADFDLVLSDIRMPDKTGYDVFAAAHRRNEALPVILMTGFGYDPDHSIVRASQEGLAAVLFKPFNVEDLLREIRSALGIISPAGNEA